ncbi:MAG: alanine racemase [Protaetiibacter sp.]
MSAPRREARIRLDALAGNVEILRRTVTPARLMAVVKADAYGHGAVPVARAAVEAGADWLGVADLDEALALRAAGIDAPLLAWLHGAEADLAAARAAGIDVGVSTLAQLEAAGAVGATVQLKLDTGLSRNGLAPAERGAVFARAAALERAGRLRVRGIMSHLSGTSPADDELQRVAFAAAVDEARAAGLDPELRHLAASLAALTQPDARLDLARVGIAMYGIAPDPALDASGAGLRSVMELVSEVVVTRRVPAGAGVSYGYTHRARGETTLALVPLGYADGIPRHASGRAEVAIGGVRYPQVGRIAMDQFVIDVGDAAVRVGDEVVVWGDPADGAPSAAEWADAAGTIGYEIVTRVGPRVARVPS